MLFFFLVSPERCGIATGKPLVFGERMMILNFCAMVYAQDRITKTKRPVARPNFFLTLPISGAGLITAMRSGGLGKANNMG